jgi:hypothetical protein
MICGQLWSTVKKGLDKDITVKKGLDKEIGGKGLCVPMIRGWRIVMPSTSDATCLFCKNSG